MWPETLFPNSSGNKAAANLRLFKVLWRLHPMDCMQFGLRLMDSSAANLCLFRSYDAFVQWIACSLANVWWTVPALLVCVTLRVSVCVCVFVCMPVCTSHTSLPPSLPPPLPPSLIPQDLGLNLAHYLLQTQPIHKQLFKNLHQEKGKLRYSLDQQDWFQTWHDNHCKPSAAIISRKKGQCIGRNNDAFCMIGKAQSCFTGFSTRGSKGSNFFCFL